MAVGVHHVPHLSARDAAHVHIVKGTLCIFTHYKVVPKGLLTFLGFFIQCEVQSLLGTSGIYLGTCSFGLFVGLFSDVMSYCVLIASCEMTRTK